MGDEFVYFCQCWFSHTQQLCIVFECFDNRCSQTAKVAILQNDISHCQAAGIYMSLASHGLIAGNDIYYTSEAGIDVRTHADPAIQVSGPGGHR